MRSLGPRAAWLIATLATLLAVTGACSLFTPRDRDAGLLDGASSQGKHGTGEDAADQRVVRLADFENPRQVEMFRTIGGDGGPRRQPEEHQACGPDR